MALTDASDLFHLTLPLCIFLGILSFYTSVSRHMEEL